MRRDLAQLLVEEGAIPAAAAERAAARQAEAGGALDTALLELGLAGEDVVLRALERASGLPAAPDWAWDASDARARRVFPSRVAERHGLAPFALEGRELSLVATHPVDLALLDEISFMLSLHLTPHVGPEWRVRALIHRLYGGALPPRLAALAAGGAAAAAPGAEAAAPEPAGAEPQAPDEGAPPPAAAADPEPPAPPPPAPAAAGFDEPGQLEPLAAAVAQVLESADFSFLDAAPPSPAPEPSEAADAVDPAPAARPSAGPGRANAPGAARVERAEPPREPASRPAPRRMGEAAAPPPPPAPGAQGRWTRAQAQAALAAAGERDEVLRVVLRYAREFFAFAAVFAVSRDAVAGHDALGEEEGEDARALCRSVAIYTSDPGVFHTAIETHAPHLGPISPEPEGNRAILDGLGRGTPRTVLVHPVVLRQRTACLLYADNGPSAVSPRRLADLVLFLAGLAPALERVIQARKRARSGVSGAGEVPAAAPAAPPPVAAPAPGPAPSPIRAATPAAQARPTPAPVAAPTGEPWQAHEPAAALADLEVDIDLFEEELGAAAPPSGAVRFDPEAEVTALLETDAGSLDRIAGLARLAAFPEAALPVVWARLPGPIESDEDGASPTALGPLAAALAALGPAAVPAMVEVLRDRDPVRRRIAATVLGAAGDPSTFPALAERVLDPDPRVAGAAIAALAAHRRHPEMRAVPEKLRRALLSGVAARTTSAARALGAIRDAESVPLLVQVLESSEREPAEAAAAALAEITLQRLGTDARRWLAWWKQNRGRGRAEWLLSGLTSAEREVRAAAAEELARAAPPPVSYQVDAPAPEREAAARLWAGWWARSGLVL
ncbi:General secretory system II protein E domain protein [Anaeromyxobacter dehalogenans 2CP-1]|uniref:General secretory system II protein E domain protein n=1 Tax=Anaeromyxobacter dehalogenans (strain ATCC BAA-258 / DSM 21875 / 2CP-1) TaxID=455488 RepID=B8J931_ANAD2|nr:HEAT repeat domain-containing protein [Anaeromyxobacter dehalogenans]ACL63629.1 General secretory system II protein E domain protein [Anaeromyxobacter dehalogenans 2CP-1]